MSTLASIGEIYNKYGLLFNREQIAEEFRRFTEINLFQRFRDGLLILEEKLVTLPVFKKEAIHLTSLRELVKESDNLEQRSCKCF